MSLFFLLTNVIVYAQYQPYNGIVNGKFSIQPTGASEYSITLEIPPGQTEATPSLSISYTNSNSNGLLGMGWSIGGLAAIDRTGATVPQDGFRGGVNYDANDRFTLNGQRLMNTAGNNSTYFNSGSTYYTELQSWTRTTANGNAGQGPASFTVNLPNGTVAQFGNGNGSQVLAQGPNFNSGSLQGSVSKWLLSQVTSPAGNSMSFYYNPAPRDLQGQRMNGSANDGTAYPDYIAYGSNNGSPNNRLICFLYEPRTDTIVQYSGGSMSRISARISAIQTFVINNQDTVPVRTYVMVYDAQSPFGISRISNITMKGSKGGSTIPLSMQWTNGATGLVSSTATWNGPHSNTGYEGDFNGDGKTDLLPVSGTTINTVYYAGNGGFTAQPLSFSFLISPNTYSADYNGDGLPDLAVLQQGSNKLYLCNQNGFNTAISAQPISFTSGCNGCVIPADFNGDGMTDLLSFSVSVANVYLSTGSGFTTAYTTRNLNLPQGSTFVADVNGDGQADLFTAGLQGGNLYLSNFSQSNAFSNAIPISPITVNTRVPQNNLLSDFNGDGLADLLTYNGTQYNLFYSTGKGFTPANPIDNLNLSNAQNWMSDYNGDGYMDMYTLSGTSAVVYYYSAGQFFNQTTSSPALNSAATWSGDFNGDGIADLFASDRGLIFFGGNAANNTVPNSNQRPFMLTGISNGIGGNLSINYVPISNPSVYSGGNYTGALLQGIRTQNLFNTSPLAPLQVTPYPYVRVQSSRYVTSNYTLSDGMGNVYPYAYKYQGSLQDVQAYGWLGFQQVTETDSSAGNITQTQYLQAFPYTGKKLVSNLYDLNNNLLRCNRYTYNLVTGSAGNNYQVQTQTTRQDHYDYGKFMYTTGVNYAYDAFGNQRLVQQLNDTSEPQNIVYTINKYINDTQGWHIGFKTDATLSPDSLANTVLLSNKFQYDPNTWLLLSNSTWLNTNNSWLPTQYGYDNWGNPIYSVTPAGDTTLTAYDNQFHTFAISNTSPANQWGNKLVTQFTTDPGTGLQTSTTDANGNTFQTIYDQFGRDSIMTGPDSTGKIIQITRIGYYKNSTTGYINTKLIPNNWAGSSWDSSAYSFDGLSRNIQESWKAIAGQAILQKYAYNSSNKIISQGLPYFSNGQAQATIIKYDPYGRPINIIMPGPQGQTIVNRFSYSGKQITLQLDSGSNSITSYRKFDYYNGKPAIIQKTDATGLITNYYFDLAGRNTSVVDPAGLTTSYTYYSTGDLLTSNNPAAGKSSFLRNYLQNNVAAISNKGDTIFTQQDALQRKLFVRTKESTRSFQYDVAGVKNGMSNLCKVTQADNKINYAYSYDAYNRVAAATTQLNGSNFTESSLYNPSGSISALQYPDGAIALYSYYGNGLMHQISLQNNAQSTPALFASFDQYTAAGDQVLVAYGNQVKRQAAFNPFGILANYSITNNAGQSLADQTYTWNGLFKISSIADNLNNKNNFSYSYYPNGRIQTASSVTETDNYVYDNSGNLSQRNNTNFVNNNQYQVTSATENGNTLFNAHYDLNGNLISRTVNDKGKSVSTQYQYNSLNQLVAVYSGQDTAHAYAYNYGGQRVLQYDHAAKTVTGYISPHYSVTWKNGKASAMKYVCVPSQMIASVSDQGQVKYLHQNFINSTLLTSDQNGNAAASWAYKPFGTMMTASGQDTTNPYLFSGMELDKSGLYYFNARYYDPVISKFITADNQLGAGKYETDAYNRYAYALNDPVKHYDPSGHFIDDWFNFDGVIGGMLAFTDPEVEVGAALTEAMADVGYEFLRSLTEGVTNKVFDEQEAHAIYAARYLSRSGVDPAAPTPKARLDQLIIKPFAEELQLVDGGTETKARVGMDSYGNEIYPNRQPSTLTSEIGTREGMNKPGSKAWAQSYNEIATMLDGNPRTTYKFTLSYDDYTLSIGDRTIKHAAIEGAGRDVYTAGTVTMEDNRDGTRTLRITNESGHYQPSLKSTHLADPIWRTLRNLYGLNFTNIIYAPVK